MSASPPLSCAACSKVGAPSYFKITRVAFEGTEAPLTVVCSVRCLFQWAYAFAQLQGMRIAYTVREVIKQLFDPLKPPPG